MNMDKTRNLSVAEYFLVIQKEYLIAEFRKKIYYNPKDKAYYQRVMTYKAKKINDIAKRNRLDSILNSSSKLEEVWILDQVKSDGTLTLYSAKLQEYEDANKDDVCRIL